MLLEGEAVEDRRERRVDRLARPIGLIAIETRPRRTWLAVHERGDVPRIFH
jgi:hypothetical protein